MYQISFLAFLAFLIVTPAPSMASIYSWKDANGVVTYSNNPTEAPNNSQMIVRSEESIEVGGVGEVGGAGLPAQPGRTFADTAGTPTPERPPRLATQGEFATQLVTELGLGSPADAGQAADILTGLRITPMLGDWAFDQPMTPELTLRLRQLTVAAADRGSITLTQEQALLAFDTTAALLNVEIPAPAEPNMVSDAPYPITEMPPLIDFYPPEPPYFPYYIWTPVAGGFWWGDYFYPGFFVLNVAQFCDHHFHDASFRFASLDPGHISHRMRGHISDHRLPGPGPTPGHRTAGHLQGGRQDSRQAGRFSAGPTSPSTRMSRSPGQPRSSFASMRSQQAAGRDARSPAATRTAYARPSMTGYHRGPSSYATTPRWSRSPQSPRSMMRTTFPSGSSSRRVASAGFRPAQSSFHGGMGMARASGSSFSGRGTFTGGGMRPSAGGFAHAGSSFHR